MAIDETTKKSPESLAHRAVQDLALEAENSVEQMLRLVDRLHRAERKTPELVPSAAGTNSNGDFQNDVLPEITTEPTFAPKLDWEKCLQVFSVLHPKCKKEYVEVFRLLRARVSLAKREWATGNVPLQLLAIVSPTSKNGKSFVATNLAAALALGSDEKVLIIDLNPLSNEMSTALGVAKSAGVPEAVRSGQWEPSVHQVGETNLFVMPAGKANENRMDSVDFRRLPLLLESLRSTFAWIILDGPAASDSSDAELLANYADANLLVMRKGVTEFSEVAQLKETIPEGRLLGAVFNSQFDEKKKSWFRRDK